MDPSLTEIIRYVDDAAAAGVIGNASYGAVQRLADWVRKNVRRRQGRATVAARASLETGVALLREAMIELPLPAQQRVNVKGSVSGNILNAPNSKIRIKQEFKGNDS